MKKVTLALLLVLVIGPMVALVQAWTASTLWSWFIAGAYGPGPSLVAWFGISLIIGLKINVALINVPREKIDDGKVITASIWRAFGICIGCLFVLGTSYVTGLLLGWV